jgi:hypothetical protein
MAITLKTHAFRKSNMKKPIDAQFEEKLQEVKDCLDKQFNYIEPSLDFNHMWMTAGGLMKTR